MDFTGLRDSHQNIAVRTVQLHTSLAVPSCHWGRLQGYDSIAEGQSYATEIGLLYIR